MKSVIRTLIITTAIVLVANLAHAQICQGSLGDPIVNITFGSGPNPGPPFSAATTTYQYTSADCPSDGLYTIRNNTLNCFGNTWHTINSDHTGDPNGYFMVVNASIQPSAFYLDTVRGLCSNTTFEFAVWMANLLVPGACGGGIQPNLTFTIEKLDGTVLQTYSTGDIPSTPTPTWQQVGFYFVTPSGAGVSDVVLRIVNNATGGCGNDLALDDITFRPCGPTVMANISGSPNDSISFCEARAQAVTFNGNVLAGLTNPALQWQQNTNNSGWQDVRGETGTTLLQDFTSKPAGTYQYRLSAVETGNLTQCKTMSRVLTVTITPGPSVDAGPDKSILLGESTQLDGSIKGGSGTFSWSPTTNMTNTNSLTPRVSPSADIDYVLSIAGNADSVCGKLSDTVHVFVYNDDIYIPNAFTPNRDGVNDTWRIRALYAIPVFELSIFNRYGQLIYHIQNNYTPWNGQFNGIVQPNGGYVYLLNVGNGKRVFKGIVMLIK